ncbi:hypothetical protein HmCmsJML291_01123 [Escherichia coli]|nr:hypothetical protein HmCmsJML291_01123 [Escherichia coli]
MHQTRLMETHFVFGRVHVDVHLMRVDLQIQHKCRLLIGPQFVFAGLADRVIDQAIAHHATVHVAILNFCQCGRSVIWIGHPAAQREIAVLPFNRQRLFEKSGAANRA